METTHFKTKNGTLLPFLMFERKKKNPATGQWEQVEPQPYLQVAHRLVWFREEHPDWFIKTTFKELTETHAICMAEIFNSEGQILAMAHKREDAKHFADFMEKCETSSIGRALAILGYGTQFAPELNEGDRLADSPVDVPQKQMEMKDNILGLETLSPPEPKKHVGGSSFPQDVFPENHAKFPGKKFDEILKTQDGVGLAMWVQKQIEMGNKKLPQYIMRFYDAAKPYLAAEFGK